MSDVLLFQTPDDGDVDTTSGDLSLTDGLESSVYMSLFGGNWQDDGTPGNPLQWWGNADTPDPQQRQVSRTQHLLQSLPPTSGNLRRVEDAVRADLAWLAETGRSIDTAASIPDINTVAITIGVDGEFITILEDWPA